MQISCFKSPLSILIMMLATSVAKGAFFYVSETDDTTNVTSLRGAVIAANAIGGDNIIILTNGIYRLTISGADEDASYTGDLDVTNGNLTILGLNNSTVTIDATGLGDRILKVFYNAQLTILNIALTGGSPPGGLYSYIEDGESGGAIDNLGYLYLENCLITNNLSGAGNITEGNGGGTSGGDGGGICSSGTLVMDSCIVSGNSAGGGADGGYGGNGGGIYNSGSCALYNCQINVNHAGSGAGPEGNFFGFAGNGGNGGGVFSAGDLTLNTCSLRGNLSGSGADAGSSSGWEIQGFPPGAGGGSAGNGGGLFASGSVLMDNCTISGNSTGTGGAGYSGSSGGGGGAGGYGAAICNGGMLTMQTCTLSGNSCGRGGNGGNGRSFLAYAGNGGTGGNGGTAGGIFNSGSLSAFACTIVGNCAGAGGLGGSGEYGVLTIDVINPDGTVGVEILAGNNGIGGMGGNGGTGGIVASTTNILNVNLCNTLISLNSPSLGGAGGQTQTTNGLSFPVASGTNGFADLDGQLFSLGYNLIGISDGSGGITNGLNGDLVGSALVPLNPLLGSLRNNGGATETMSPLPGSPTIDAGNDALLAPPYNLSVDQRGQRRKLGAHVDIGAVEYDGLINGIVQPPLLMSPQQPGNEFQVFFNGATQIGYSVFGSTNLVNWVWLGTASEISPGWFYFADTTAVNYAERFYEVRQP